MNNAYGSKKRSCIVSLCLHLIILSEMFRKNILHLELGANPNLKRTFVVPNFFPLPC